MKVCLVGSSGGHLTHLYMLKPFWKDKEHFWVTFDKEDAKLAALISIMPQSVLGGAAVMMFSSIVVSGIQLITKWPVGPRNVTIVSVALGLGYGLGSNTAILVHLPQAISLIFGGSGIVPAAVFAIILNIVLPKDEKTDVERAEEMLEKVKNK